MDPGREGIGREDRLTTARAGGGAERLLGRVVGSTPLLLLLFAAWLACTAGIRPLLLPDEGRYANVAREMLLGNGWVPTLNGLPFFHKPPLMYWLDMAAMQVVGIGPFASRFASLVGAWLMGASLFLALRRWHGVESARLALLVLATTPFGFLAAQYANHDMLVGGLITLAVLCFVRALDAMPKPALEWIVGAWVACALALLTKGLIGVVLPALVVGPWLLAQRRWREVLRLLHPLGLLAFVVVAGPWLVAMQSRYPGFFDYFIVEQHFRRYADSSFNNVHPFWFFVVVLPALTLPWSGSAALQWRRLVGLRGPHVALLVWWVAAVVGFFSAPSSKLVGYALPALAPWCALMALATLSAGKPAVRQQRAVRVMALAATLLCLAIPLALAWQSPNSHRAAALQLAARMAPREHVVMIDEYLYDVPFYAGLREPVLIVGDWADPDLPRHDNWRKELFDAGRFDPATARDVLVPTARLATLTCGSHGAWFVLRAGSNPPDRAVVSAALVYADAHTQLWHAPGRHDC